MQTLLNHISFPDKVVVVQGAAATPVELLRAMTQVGSSRGVKNVKLYHMHLEGEAIFASPENASELLPGFPFANS